MVPILVIERSKDDIDGVEELPPDVAALVCWALCEDEEVIE